MTASYPEIELRYFNVRGRAQFIRGLLSHRNVRFNDVRVTLAEDLSSWQQTRQNRQLTGSFQKLPSLSYGGIQVSETLVIVNFLHQKLGDASMLDEHQNLQHAMLASSTFLDLLTPCINLIWSETLNPGVKLQQAAAAVKRRLLMHLATVNQTLHEWQWLEGMDDRPVMAADALLWEALDMIGRTFAGSIPLKDFAALADFSQHCPGAGSFRILLQQEPLPLTACPPEADVLERIRLAEG